MATKKKSNNSRNAIIARAKSAYSKVGDKVEDVRGSAEGFIKKRPLTSIGIAAGAGALIGASIALGSYHAYESRRRNSFWARLTSWF